MRCRLNAPLLALAWRDNHRAAVTIPAGRIIDVLRHAEDERFSVVGFEGEELLALESDLLARGTLLKDADKERTRPSRAKRASND